MKSLSRKDFVDGGTRRRAMTLDNIEGITVSGTDIMRQTSQQPEFRFNSSSRNKDESDIDPCDTGMSRQISPLQPLDGGRITDYAFPRTSDFNPRTMGRESDIMYADALRNVNGSGNKSPSKKGDL